MKNCALKTAVAALAISILALFGCETVVTDVNAELAAIYPEEDLGIPVNFNENYIEVAYNPSAGTTEDAEVEDESEKIEERTSENTEVVAEENPENDEDALNVSEDETESEDEDVEDEDTDEDADSESEESEEDSETEVEVAEEDEGDSDLNSSMAEENFDAEFYARTYPDVVAVFGDSAEALYKHYQDYGKAEGRSCNEEEFALLNETAN